MTHYSNFQRIWLEAAQDLSVAVELNFQCKLATGENIIAPIYLAGFGHSRGMLLFERLGDMSGYEEDMNRLGYGYSVQSPLPTDKYERPSFIEMLVDWGWSGPLESIPAWFSEIDIHE